MRDTKRGRDIVRGRSRFPVGRLMWDLIPGPQDHDPSQRQMLNQRATQVPPTYGYSEKKSWFLLLEVFFFLRLYLLEREMERRGRGRSRPLLRGAQDPRIMTWAESEMFNQQNHPGAPFLEVYYQNYLLIHGEFGEETNQFKKKCPNTAPLFR